MVGLDQMISVFNLMEERWKMCAVAVNKCRLLFWCFPWISPLKVSTATGFGTSQKCWCTYLHEWLINFHIFIIKTWKHRSNYYTNKKWESCSNDLLLKDFKSGGVGVYAKSTGCWFLETMSFLGWVKSWLSAHLNVCGVAIHASKCHLEWGSVDGCNIQVLVNFWIFFKNSPLSQMNPVVWD